MAEVKANVLLEVPLIFEKVYKGMWKQAESCGEVSKLRNAINFICGKGNADRYILKS